ncbi:MAG: DHH family phosphoesterase [Tuberibacillus sp.]
MSKEWKCEGRRLMLYIAAFLVFIFVGLTTVINPYIGIVGFVVFLIAALLLRRVYVKQVAQAEEYISTLSYRIKKAGEEALQDMPIGVVLYNEDYNIEWLNHFMVEITHRDNKLISKSLDEISEALIPMIIGENEGEIVELEDRRYRVMLKPEERLLYFFDVTEILEIKTQYENKKTVFGILCIDNYDEITQGMDDQVKSRLNNDMTNLLKDWATEYGIYLKRFSSEKFVVVMNQQILRNLEKTRFDILDKIREETSDETVPLTISIGVGVEASNLIELGQLAQSALDLALGRGGDQVAIKQPSGKVKFFGGKTNPIEKRTRVRARVISHALSELIRESDQVLVMGHKQPDMDAIGSAIGIMKIAEACGKPAHIVLEHNQFGTGIIRLIELVKQKEELWQKFIISEHANERVTHETLVVVVDTHRPEMVAEPRLLNRSERIVVIDHHRRGEDFIEDPVLVYMEPYASSTAELVTELLEYQTKQPKLGVLEATALLAGITVDTKNFTLRTGARTFDAASYLRVNGADTVLVQKLLREDLDQYKRRSKLIQKTKIYRDHIAIAVGDEEDIDDQVIIAQAADTLLSIDGIKASFVISKRPDGQVGISARSLGDINVQVIMESLGGGGHLTNAATQLDLTLDEAEERLKEAINSFLEGGDSE